MYEESARAALRSSCRVLSASLGGELSSEAMALTVTTALRCAVESAQEASSSGVGWLTGARNRASGMLSCLLARHTAMNS